MSNITSAKQLPLYKGREYQPKRILYIQRPQGGGSSISLLELVKGLDKNRFEPIVLFYQDNAFKDRFRDADIDIVCLKPKKPASYKINSTRMGVVLLQKLRRLIAYTLPLVIHLVWIIKKYKIDIVHQNIGFDKEAMIAAILTGKIQVCHFRLFAPIPKTVRYLSKFVDNIIYISESVRRYYSDVHKTLQNTQIVYDPIAPNLLDKTESRRLLCEEYSLSDNDIVIANIGRVTSWKGQIFFLRAIEQLLPTFPDIKVLIVGAPGANNPDHHYLKCLEDYVESNDLLRQSVIFTGARNDVDKIMSAANVVVHSAIEPEPFGLVVAEAMAAGTPVIASRDGGVMEIIEDQVTGLLVNPKNIKELGDALRKLLESEERVDLMTARSKQHVASKFSINEHVGQIQTIYLQSIDNRKQKALASGLDQQVY